MIELFGMWWIRPWWLLLIGAGALMPWVMHLALRTSNVWHGVLGPALSHQLQQSAVSVRWIGGCAAAGLITAGIGLAGPSWLLEEVPAARNNSELVIVVQLSEDMDAEAPQALSAMAQARLKLADILRLRTNGRTALIGYAGTAHLISPTTLHSGFLGILGKQLSPSVAPVRGNDLEAAVDLALATFTNAAKRRTMILIAMTGSPSQSAMSAIDQSGIRLLVLGVGSDRPTPISEDGVFERSDNGELTLARRDDDALAAAADAGGGTFRVASFTEEDIEDYARDHCVVRCGDGIEGSATHQPVDSGYWLLPLLLACAFPLWRRGVLLALALTCMPLNTWAAESSFWDDLWQTRDQQAQEALDDGDPTRAAALFEDHDRKAYALALAGDHAQAAEILKQSSEDDDARRHAYNLGTELAQSGDLHPAKYWLERAIPWHDETTAVNVDDVQRNLDLVLDAIAEQQQDQEDQSQDTGDGDQSDEREASDSPSDSEDGNDQQAQDEGSQPSDPDNEGAQSSDQQPSEQSGESASESQQEGEQDSQAQETDAAPDQEATAASDEGEGDDSLEAQFSDAERARQEELKAWLRALPNDQSDFLRARLRCEVTQSCTER